ncbi:MAG TPA: tripartite tricarboxylate transporter substrate binding protein [Ramlibacter sp.]|nr:tripartite tricarboxylate transporter substrate binding protein [Ramlibacter sp.]
MRTLRFLALGLAMAVGAASAQTYPDKTRPIKLVVPSGAGTSADLLARALARGMADVAGLNVVVDNKAGADGVIGAQAVKNAPPDGYTLLLTSSSTQAINPHLFNHLPYDPVTDFVPVAGIAKTSLVMNAGPTVTAKTAREFIASARVNPGKYTFGNGTATTRLAGELLQTLTGIKLLSVPYKNLADAMQGLAAGQLDLVFIDAASASSYYKLGVRPLAVTGTTRTPALPNVPTLREEGVAGYDITGWFATYLPAKTPPEVAASLRDIVQKAAAGKYVSEVLANFSMEPLEFAGNDLMTFQRAEAVKWGKLVREAKMGPQQ